MKWHTLLTDKELLSLAEAAASEKDGRRREREGMPAECMEASK